MPPPGLPSEPEGRPPGPAFEAQRLSRTYDVQAVQQQRRRTLELLDASGGHSVLDVGCGPGHLVSDLAGAVPGARVVGVDRQGGMLEVARSRAHDLGVADRVGLLRADATALPLRSAAFDRVVAVQVLEYVPAVERALSELHRVLVPGGTGVVVDMDWRSCVWHTDDNAATQRVLRSWEDHFVHPRLPAALPALARAAGFRDVQVHDLPVVEVDTSEDTYSIGMAAVIASFVGRNDGELARRWRADVLRQAAAGSYSFSLVRTAAVLTR